jgi:hypothetical protein
MATERPLLMCTGATLGDDQVRVDCSRERARTVERMLSAQLCVVIGKQNALHRIFLERVKGNDRGSAWTSQSGRVPASSQNLDGLPHDLHICVTARALG